MITPVINENITAHKNVFRLVCVFTSSPVIIAHPDLIARKSRTKFAKHNPVRILFMFEKPIIGNYFEAL